METKRTAKAEIRLLLIIRNTADIQSKYAFESRLFFDLNCISCIRMLTIFQSGELLSLRVKQYYSIVELHWFHRLTLYMASVVSNVVDFFTSESLEVLAADVDFSEKLVSNRQVLLHCARSIVWLPGVKNWRLH